MGSRTTFRKVDHLYDTQAELEVMVMICYNKNRRWARRGLNPRLPALQDQTRKASSE